MFSLANNMIFLYKYIILSKWNLLSIHNVYNIFVIILFILYHKCKMNTVIGQHTILLQAADRKEAEQHVRTFFAQNELVRYDSLVIDAGTIFNGTHQQFFAKIEDGLTGNRLAIEKLVQVLRAEDAADLQAWSSLPQGYASKILHTLVHLVDGFFGVDSVLYNLVEDSNQVTPLLRKKIREQPNFFWLVPVTGVSARNDADRVQLLRPFGRENKGWKSPNND